MRSGWFVKSGVSVSGVRISCKETAVIDEEGVRERRKKEFDRYAITD